MARRFFTWILIFLGFSLVFQNLFPNTEQQEVRQGEDVEITFSDESLRLRQPFSVTVENFLDQELSFESKCPLPPLQLQRYGNGKWVDLKSDNPVSLSCGPVSDDDLNLINVPEQLVLGPRSSLVLDFSPWKDELITQYGRHRAVLNVEIDSEVREYIQEFEVEERGFISSVAYQLFFRPLYNAVIGLTDIIPGKQIGFGIIVATFLIRLLLLLPNQKALQSQKKMMKLQPELEKIKKQHKGDQARISQETLALWQKHKVSPVGGCLPVLLQLPLLIAIFYVVREGFTVYQTQHLYPFFANLDLATFNQNFLGFLDLTGINRTWLPVVVGLLQFVQLKLSFSMREKKSGKKDVIDIKANGEPDLNQIAQDPMKMMNKTMLYIMPLMLAFMTATFPAGVGLYLIVSTLFGIFQQYSVNRKTA